MRDTVQWNVPTFSITVVVSRLKEDPGDRIIFREINLDVSDAGLPLNLGFLDDISTSCQFSRGLDAVEGSALGSSVHCFVLCHFLQGFSYPCWDVSFSDHA